MQKPTEEQVKAAVAEVVANHRRIVRAVIAHGSWVRGDFWPGQSDLDLIVVGCDGNVPALLRAELEELKPSLCVSVEPWETSEHALSAIRAERPPGGAISECRIGQFDISGFDVVDRHEVVWGAGADPLDSFPVPRGNDLQGVARRRVQALCNEISQYGAQEMNRIACDALKAAAIFFLLRANLPPTRNKNEVLHRFFEVVPAFEEKDTARWIWKLYRAADKLGDASHQLACRDFVVALRRLVDQFPTF